MDGTRLWKRTRPTPDAVGIARRSSLPGRLLILAVALATAAVVVPGVAGAEAGATSAGGGYVALGDSYTAGPLIPNQSLDPLGCLRSDHNYPHVIAPYLPVSSFTDASCSGATTGDMTSSQGVTPGPNPPQFDALSAGTRVVTLGIGGNDIGFSDIIKSCATLWPYGSPCLSKYVVNGVDTLAQTIDATAPKVAAVLTGIRARSPHAKVFVVGYPDILPTTGSGCWPSLPLAYRDVPYLRQTEMELDAMLSSTAAANGAVYVDTYTPSIGHDACQSESTRWVEPIVPGSAAAPVHPNATGEFAMGLVTFLYMYLSGI